MNCLFLVIFQNQQRLFHNKKIKIITNFQHVDNQIYYNYSPHKLYIIIRQRFPRNVSGLLIPDNYNIYDVIKLSTKHNGDYHIALMCRLPFALRLNDCGCFSKNSIFTDSRILNMHGKDLLINIHRIFYLLFHARFVFLSVLCMQLCAFELLL